MFKHSKTIAWLSGLTTIAIAGLSFALSFNALKHLAHQHGVSIPWAFPILLEGSVIVFSLSALLRSLQGEAARWQWALIIGSSILAGIFNVLHSDKNLTSQAMSAIPTLFLILSFETFLGQIKYTFKRDQVVKSIEQLNQDCESVAGDLENLTAEFNTLEGEFNRKSEQVSQVTAQLDTLALQLEEKTLQADRLTSQIEEKQILLQTLKAQIQEAQNLLKTGDFTQSLTDLEKARQAKAELGVKSKEGRQAAILQHFTANPTMAIKDLAEVLNVSRPTIYSDLKELENQGKIYRNGQGVMVK